MSDNIDDEFHGLVAGVQSEDAARDALAWHLREVHGIYASAGPLTGVVELEAIPANVLFERHDRLHEEVAR